MGLWKLAKDNPRVVSPPAPTSLQRHSPLRRQGFKNIYDRGDVGPRLLRNTPAFFLIGSKVLVCG